MLLSLCFGVFDKRGSSDDGKAAVPTCPPSSFPILESSIKLNGFYNYFSNIFLLNVTSKCLFLPGLFASVCTFLSGDAGAAGFKSIDSYI